MDMRLRKWLNAKFGNSTIGMGSTMGMESAMSKASTIGKGSTMVIGSTMGMSFSMTSTKSPNAKGASDPMRTNMSHSKCPLEKSGRKVHLQTGVLDAGKKKNLTWNVPYFDVNLRMGTRPSTTQSESSPQRPCRSSSRPGPTPATETPSATLRCTQYDPGSSNTSQISFDTEPTWRPGTRWGTPRFTRL